MYSYNNAIVVITNRLSCSAPSQLGHTGECRIGFHGIVFDESQQPLTQFVRAVLLNEVPPALLYHEPAAAPPQPGVHHSVHIAFKIRVGDIHRVYIGNTR